MNPEGEFKWRADDTVEWRNRYAMTQVVTVLCDRAHKRQSDPVTLDVAKSALRAMPPRITAGVILRLAAAEMVP